MPASTPTNAVVVDTSQSRFARLRSVPLTAVTLTDAFWAARRQINHAVTLPEQYRLIEETGRIDNFRRAAGKVDHREVPFRGFFFNDSDIYKWIEAAAWTLAAEDDSALAQMVEAAIDEIADAQQPDGYLDTYFTFERGAERWTNLRDLHELYCAGHLIQAAVAHFRATGSDRLLSIARRFVDHIDSVFGSEGEGKRLGVGGHPEIEMALVELARLTGEANYQKLAAFFIDTRGRGVIGGSPYHQDHQPLREMDRMTGHAVRAVYLNCGAADLCAETGEPALRSALDRMWDNMVTRQMYVSGGIGSRYLGKAFGADYELPNARAYTETCAAIGSIMWNWRMLALEGDARYADVIETALYNGFLSGVSLDGKAYFYVNPLADDGMHRRQPWFECACCPPNVARMLASLQGYFYSVSGEGVWAHLYAEGSARLTLPDGRVVNLKQRTRYPWEGAVAFEVAGEGEFSLFLRVPAWCEDGAALEVNGRASDGEVKPGIYAQIHRRWQPGDVVRLSLPMPVRRVEAHPYAAENLGRVALTRGPLLYCVEGVDHPGVDLRDIVLPADAALSADYRADLLGGVVILRGEAMVVPPDCGWEGRLYRTVRVTSDAPQSGRLALTVVPYYAWANRDPGTMQVWLRV